MNGRSNTVQSIPAYLALLLLLFAGSSHIHLRYCLDGDEVPVSIHFESSDTHSGDSDSAHEIAGSDQADVENELSLDLVFGKSYKSSIEAITLSSINLLTVGTPSLAVPLPILVVNFPEQRTSLYPPSRAPPEIV
jgi:hypothetical protein